MMEINTLEAQLRSRINVSQPKVAFQNRLEAQLGQAWDEAAEAEAVRPKPRLAWAGLAALLVLGILVLAAGPAAVWAQIRGLLGFVPGVGVVDSNAPLRVLAEPVRVTRDGISLEVNSAMVSPEVSYLDYQVFGVPASALAPDGQVQTCTQEAYLRLPDGSRLQRRGPAWPGLPSDLTTVTLVVPCLEGTREGTVPEGWELKLRLITPDEAPVQLPLLEVIRATPTTGPAAEAATDEANLANPGWAFEVSTVIETPRGYILAGPGLQGNLSDRIEIMHPVSVKDAQGRAVPAALPAEFPKLHQSGAIPNHAWAIQFASEGLAMPLELSAAVETQRMQMIAVEPVQISLDMDSAIEDGQERNFDQAFELGGTPFRLVSIRAAADGYRFTLEAPGDVIDLDLEVEGHPAIGAGGGGSGGPAEGERHLIELNRVYATRPMELQLRLVVSGYTLMSAAETRVHTLSWTPSAAHAPYLQAVKPAGSVCLSPDGLQMALDTPFAGAGWAYFSRNEGGSLPNLYRVDLATGGQKLLAVNVAWPAIAASGEALAYPGETSVKALWLEHPMPYDLSQQALQVKWSPDGRQLAALSMQSNVQDQRLGLISTDLNSSSYTQLLDTGYAYIAGWMPDGKSVIFLTAALNLNGWKVQRYDLENKANEELFTMNTGTIKYLDPELSPDGEWLAYRALDSSSVRIVRLDGSEDHLLAESLHAVELSWASPELLALSLSVMPAGMERTVLVNINTCAVQALPAEYSGTVAGIKIE